MKVPVLTWLFFLMVFSGKILYSQSSFPQFPPENVTNQMDRDQMLWQLGISLPSLPAKNTDPNRPAEAFPSDKNNPEGNWTNEKKYTFARSAFGLWNNYSDKSYGFFPGPDSARLGDYRPIDLLRMKDGRKIQTTDEWWSLRRPEILNDLKEELYGKMPPDSILPRVSWSVVTTSGGKGSAAYIQKELTGTIDISRYPAVRNRPVISATLRTPANATKGVPVMIFFGGFGNAGEMYWNRSYPHGWGTCIFNLNQLQPDNGAGLTSYLIGLVNKGNWRKPTDWGTLVAWSWGVSRLIDYFETDGDVNPEITGLTGHSRYGKATLVTMAYEPRVAIGFPSDGGSLGTKMNRRHWGQDLEHSTGANEYHWMAGSFFKWAGEKFPGKYLPRKIDDCPVDAHSLLALCAPRPVLLNGGTTSSWTDPYGQFLTTVYATPVYKLLGKEGIIINDAVPVVDKSYIDGTIAFRYHNGGHTDSPEWPAFFEFAARQFHIPFLTTSVSSLVLAPAENLSEAFSVSSGSSWNASCPDKWIKIERFSKDSVRVTASANKRYARAALITITSEGRKQVVAVNQASARPSLDLPLKDIATGAAGGSASSFDIISNTSWSVSCDAPWLNINEDSGINNRKILLSAIANPRVEQRSAVITVTSPGLAPGKILVTQEKALPVLNVMSENLNLRSEDGSNASVMITSNTQWNLTVSGKWLAASTSTGNGFRQVVFTALENNELHPRTAKITIIANGLPPKIINVIQKARHEE